MLTTTPYDQGELETKNKTDRILLYRGLCGFQKGFRQKLQNHDMPDIFLTKKYLRQKVDSFFRKCRHGFATFVENTFLETAETSVQKNPIGFVFCFQFALVVWCSG